MTDTETTQCQNQAICGANRGNGEESLIKLTKKEKELLLEMTTRSDGRAYKSQGANQRVANSLVKKGLAEGTYDLFWKITPSGRKAVSTEKTSAEIVLCACIGSIHGEPYCPCEMSRRGLSPSQERIEADKESALRLKELFGKDGKLSRKLADVAPTRDE